MKRQLVAILVGFCLISSLGCDEYVEKSKYDESQKQTADLKKQLAETSNELKKAQQTIAEYQSHKYQFMNVTGRTWRFDTITGRSCIQLTSEADWKRKDTKGESCDCLDLFDGSTSPDEGLRKIYCGW
jgi:hypothetical protein